MEDAASSFGIFQEKVCPMPHEGFITGNDMKDNTKNSSQKPLYRLITAVFAIVCKGDKILLVNNIDSFLFSRWTLPGGKVEEGETFYEALVREVFEETAYQIVQANIAYIHEAFFPKHSAHVRAIVFNVNELTEQKEEEFKRSRDPAKSVIEARWIPQKELSNFFANKEMLQVLEQWLTHKPSCNYVFSPHLEW